MSKLRVLDLFSGIGGFSLGLERTGGFETVAFCEIEPFPRKVLAKHWPGVPCYHDVRTLTKDILDRDGIAVDVICGGFPCQPFSTASAGRRIATDLWPEYARLIKEIAPKYVIAENVHEQPLKRFASVCERLGYRTVVKCIGAHEGGADHKRDRWWGIAYADDQSQLRSAIDAEVALLPELCESVWGWENYARAIRVPHGVPNRTYRLKSLGNSVIPQIPEALGYAIVRGAIAHGKELIGIDFEFERSLSANRTARDHFIGSAIPQSMRAE